MKNKEAEEEMHLLRGSVLSAPHLPFSATLPLSGLPDGKTSR